MKGINGIKLFKKNKNTKLNFRDFSSFLLPVSRLVLSLRSALELISKQLFPKMPKIIKCEPNTYQFARGRIEADE